MIGWAMMQSPSCKWLPTWFSSLTIQQDYLSKLDPPIAPIPDEKLFRWHPRFPLDKIPNVQPTDIPMPQMAATFNTAKDVLDKARQMMVNPKVSLEFKPSQYQACKPDWFNSIYCTLLCTGLSLLFHIVFHNPGLW